MLLIQNLSLLYNYFGISGGIHTVIQQLSHISNIKRYIYIYIFIDLHKNFRILHMELLKHKSLLVHVHRCDMCMKVVTCWIWAVYSQQWKNVLHFLNLCANEPIPKDNWLAAWLVTTFLAYNLAKLDHNWVIKL